MKAGDLIFLRNTAFWVLRNVLINNFFLKHLREVAAQRNDSI